MRILAIDTSADDTSCAILEDERILSNIVSSQINIHKEWGGIVPSVAKRAHEERIGPVVELALKRAKTNLNDIDVVAVTQGPGLAIALEVGVKKAKEIVNETKAKLVAVDHMTGHIYANFAQNSKGNPKREINFPLLALLVSGGHTELIEMKENFSFLKIGQTLDDAAGEAYDKVGRMLGFGYPGGPFVAEQAKLGNPDAFDFPRPLSKQDNLNFSFSGLKTALLYKIKELEEKGNLSKKTIADLSASFEQAVIDTLLIKTKKAFKQTDYKQLLLGGGVIANQHLKQEFRKELKKIGITVFAPPFKILNGDNAAMIGLAGYQKALQSDFITNIDELDRNPVLSLEEKN